MVLRNSINSTVIMTNKDAVMIVDRDDACAVYVFVTPCGCSQGTSGTHPQVFYADSCSSRDGRQLRLGTRWEGGGAEGAGRTHLLLA